MTARMNETVTLIRKGYVRPLDLKHGRVDLTHGSGGRAMAQLIEELFARHLGNEYLAQGNDGALLPALKGRLVMSTDAHVVSPLFFPGGDIGCLSVHGTINDIAVMGATPLYLAASFILEEGFPLGDLARIVESMANAAKEAGVPIVTGDTKVVEQGKGDGVFITTTGVGVEGDTSSGIGVHGTAFGGTGVRGHSISSIGVEGTGGEYGVKGALSGLSGYGVYGDGIDTGTGVEGVSSSIGHPGVRGVNTNADADAAGVSGDGAFGPGVKGTSAGSTGVIGQAMTYGVYGQAMTYGVYGTSDITGVEGVGGVRGVHGHSDQGSGVVATTVKGWALEVQATGTGTGVHAESAGGTALDVTGKVVFNRSGRATIASGKSSLVVTVPGGVAATSLCFATLTVFRSGVSVAAVRPNYPAGKMTVYLNKAIGARTVLSWVVLG